MPILKAFKLFTGFKIFKADSAAALLLGHDAGKAQAFRSEVYSLSPVGAGRSFAGAGVRAGAAGVLTGVGDGRTGCGVGTAAGVAALVFVLALRGVGVALSAGVGVTGTGQR